MIDWIMVSSCSYPKGIKNLSESEPSMKKLTHYHSKARILDDVNGKGIETQSSYKFFLHMFTIYLENLLKLDGNTLVDSSITSGCIDRVLERYHTYNDSDILLKIVVDKMKIISETFQ
jgi:hypothetical protein